MEFTIIFVSWLKFFNQQTDTQMVVERSIDTVYTTLKKEGIDVQIVKINEDEPEIVSLEEVNEEQEGITYKLDVNLADSEMPLKRFNELLGNWGISQVSA